jgi:hypothetical protein
MGTEGWITVPTIFNPITISALYRIIPTHNKMHSNITTIDTVGELIFVSILPHKKDEITSMICARTHFLAKRWIKAINFSHKNEFANSITITDTTVITTNHIC